MSRHPRPGRRANKDDVAQRSLCAARRRRAGEQFWRASAPAGQDFPGNSFIERVVTPMIHNATTKVLLAAWLTLLLLYSSGGCARSCRSGGPDCGGSGLLRCLGCRDKSCPVCVIDPVCHGYEATCWYPWPEECVGCPMDLMQVETEIIATGEAIENGPNLPHDAGVPEEPISLPPDAADSEPIAPPDSDTGGGQDETALPLEENREKTESSPFREEGPSPGGDGPGILPETSDGVPLEDQVPLPELSPANDSQTRAKPSSMLRFVAFSTSEPTAPDRLISTSQIVRGDTGKLTQARPKEGKYGHHAPASRPAGQSFARDARRELQILEALKTSVSSRPRVIQLPKPNRSRHWEVGPSY